MRQVKAETLQAGDYLVSYFARKDKDYPEPEKIERVIHEPTQTILIFEDGKEDWVMDGMMVIIEEKS